MTGMEADGRGSKSANISTSTQVRDMIGFFEELGQMAALSRTQFLICFSSRRYPHISTERSIELILEDQDGHMQDITKYIRSKLRTNRNKRADQIREEIRERSSAIFLWVVLVIQLLWKAFDSGRITDVSDRLRSIPDGLDKLFRDMLTRDSGNMADLLLCLQWVLFADRPLRSEELYFAIHSGIDWDAVTLCDHEAMSSQDMDKFILDSSKGLAELTKTKNQTVQFIHESVRDFLLKDNGLSKLGPDLSSNSSGLSRERLKQCCHHYFTMVAEKVQSLGSWPSTEAENAEVSSELTKRFPFLEYAVHHVLRHAEAAAVNDVLQDDSIASFPLSQWICLDNLLQRFRIRRQTSDASMIYILAENDLANLAHAELRRTKKLNTREERYSFPAAVACVNSSKRMVELLLRHRANSNVQIKEHHSPLFLAIQRNRKGIVELLLTKGARVDEYKTYHFLPIHAAAEIGSDRLVSLLLTYGLEVDGFDQKLDTILPQVASRGHDKILHMLLGADANANARDESHGSALQAASAGGYEKIVQILLRKEADTNARSGPQGTALEAASRSGHENIVQILLEASANRIPR